MKYLIAIGLLVFGLIIGFFWGKSSVVIDNNPITTDNIDTPEVIRDTIVQTETIHVPVTVEENDSTDLAADSTLNQKDSLLAEVIFEDTTDIEEDISINTEKLLKKIKLPISYLEVEVDSDSTIKEMLGIEESRPSHIYVEFWQSPLNFEGYKLSKNKLVLYGLSTQFNYQFYRKSNQFYLSYQDIYYLMRETQEFLPYLQVAKKEVFD